MRTEILIIDPQNDFCVKDDGHGNKGQLYVPGGEDDCKRMASMISKHKTRIHDIHITMDSHHLLDIAHPLMWKNDSGNHPNPFTVITEYDRHSGMFNGVEVLNGMNPVRLKTNNPKSMDRAIAYVQALKANNRYDLCIWPPHCLIGTWGHNIESNLLASIHEWEMQYAFADIVTKGSNMWTEHYSAVKADVPDDNDETTQLNTRLIETIKQADRIIVGGEASSHCWLFTMKDIADNFGDSSLQKFVLLEDGTSPVTGFESVAEAGFKELVDRGMQVAKTTDVF